MQMTMTKIDQNCISI